MRDTDTTNSMTVDAGPTPTAGEQAPFRLLLVVTTAGTTQAVEFGQRQALSLGRSEPADIRVSDPSLSRLHASFTREGQEVRVSDLESRNGTWLAGKRLEEDAVLRPGDAVVAGSTTVFVQVVATPATAMLGVQTSAAILRRIDEEWLRARTFRRPLCVMAVRPLRAGQVATRELATLCLDALRAVDHVGLYDRSSMLVALPEMHAEQAAKLAAELCAPARGRGQITCGIASYPASGTTAEQLVSAAWRAARGTSEEAPVAVAPQLQAVREALQGGVVRQSPAMLQLADMVRRVARRPLPVLVRGETGSGKEVVAHELHQLSPRAAAPLKVVNCAAIPSNLIESVLFGHEKGAFTGADRMHRGVFEQARGGTVFLDEVGELSPEAQAALLRVLDSRRLTRVGGTEEIEVDVRIVAATHRDLGAMVDEERFRLDLYHRLDGVTLHLPALRDRPQDIEPLARHFLSETCSRWGSGRCDFEPAVLSRFMQYRWPGNVRELRNVVERAVALAEGQVIGVAELPDHIASPTTSLTSHSGLDESEMHATDLRESLRNHEVRLIRDALTRSGGNQRQAAELLQVPLRTFQRRLSQLGINRSD